MLFLTKQQTFENEFRISFADILGSKKTSGKHKKDFKMLVFYFASVQLVRRQEDKTILQSYFVMGASITHMPSMHV